MASLKLTAPTNDRERTLMRLRTQEIEARAEAQAADSAYHRQMWLMHANNCARIVKELGGK